MGRYLLVIAACVQVVAQVARLHERSIVLCQITCVTRNEVRNAFSQQSNSLAVTECGAQCTVRYAQRRDARRCKSTKYQMPQLGLIYIHMKRCTGPRYPMAFQTLLLRARE
jgi:hypothetical protein